ncbi:Vacuole morphology and inheritance protein 14 [Phytophthora cactorum]|nr:Vacuole morphology and inheritance protein 14 [Phytophthora cactorum]
MSSSYPTDPSPMLPHRAAAAAAMPFSLGGGDAPDANGFSRAAASLSPNLMANLGDRSYDKRKGAAMELENLIKQLQENAASIEFPPATQLQLNQDSPSSRLNASTSGTEARASMGFPIRSSRLVKDIVTESEYFDVDMFIPLLHKYSQDDQPVHSTAIGGWITVLDSVPDIDMLDWLPEFSGRTVQYVEEIKQTEDVEFGRMVDILEFVNLGREKLVEFYADLLAAIMHCISDAEHESDRWLNRPRAYPMAALRWISMLLEKYPNQLSAHIGQLLPALLRTLSDISDSVVLLDLEVLARISLNKVEFEKDRRLLEMRGSMIVRKLCVLLDAKSIYLIFAKVLGTEATLNLILLTANELEHLRDILRRSFQPRASEDDVEVFTALFPFSLCLLAQSYSLSAALISKFADIDASVGFLMQIDKLVQLLESPIFIHMRLQLLEIQEDYHTDLVKSLYGLLMLLPQSAAFRVLRDRLASVTSMATAIGRIDLNGDSRRLRKSGEAPASTSSNDAPASGAPRIDAAALLAHFENVQAKHTELRRKGMYEKSLAKEQTSANV